MYGVYTVVMSMMYGPKRRREKRRGQWNGAWIIRTVGALLIVQYMHNGLLVCSFQCDTPLHNPHAHQCHQTIAFPQSSNLNTIKFWKFAIAMSPDHFIPIFTKPLHCILTSDNNHFIRILQSPHFLKGVCHEIFDLQFFS